MDRPFYDKGLRFECQQTGQCCSNHGDHAYVYADLDERRQLAELLGMKTAAFTRRYCTKTEGHVHFKDRDNGCPFLDGPKCGVYTARPRQCRTWPFWPENMNAKTWNGEIAPFCPGIGKGRLYSPVEIESLLEEHVDD